MARIFGDLELGYLWEVLESGKLGWYHEEGSVTTRLEEAFAKKIGVGYAVARNSAMTTLAQAVSVSGAWRGLRGHLRSHRAFRSGGCLVL